MAQPFGKHPGQRGSGCGNLGGQHSHAGGTVGGNSGTGIEAEPAHPQHGSTDEGIGHVMGGHGRGGIAFALAHDQTGHETCDTRVDVDHRAARKVQDAPVPQQTAIAAPYHVGNRQIDHGQPYSAEQQQGRELHALGKSAHNQRRSNDGKRHLKGNKDRFGNGSNQAIPGHSRHEGLG